MRDAKRFAVFTLYLHCIYTISTLYLHCIYTISTLYYTPSHTTRVTPNLIPLRHYRHTVIHGAPRTGLALVDAQNVTCRSVPCQCCQVCFQEFTQAIAPRRRLPP